MATILTLPANATGLPTVEPEPGERDLSRAYQNIQTNPGQFGAQVGQATEQLGAAALKAADFYNQAASEEAYTKYQHGINNLMFGDPDVVGPDGKPDTGFMGLSGDDAMRARPIVQKKIESLLQETKGGLYTGQSQLEFERNSRRLQAITYEQMGRHYEQQAHVWGISVSKSGMAA